MGIYSIGEAYIVLKKPGISAHVRTLIFRRHTSSICIFFVCNIYVFAYTFYHCYKFNLDVNTTPVW